MRALQEVITAMQGGQWAEAFDLYTTAKSAWQELRNTHDVRSVLHNKPRHLFLVRIGQAGSFSGYGALPAKGLRM